MSTFEKVRDITVEQLSVDADEVKMESAFIDDLGADSLDIVELNSVLKFLMKRQKRSALLLTQ